MKSLPQRILPQVLSLIAVCTILVPQSAARSDTPHWIRLNSDHFCVVTDADEKRGRQVIVHFEQMRGAFAQLLMRDRINLPKPLDIIGFRNDEEYGKVAPLKKGQTTPDAVFFLPGDDRDYFVLNLARDDGWSAIARDFALILLNYNYPATQAWFDEGFADYFSSLRLDGKQVQIGGDPQSFFAVLGTQEWLPMPALFSMSDDAASPQHRLFQAESWIVLHYLLSQRKLPQAGAYFDLVENQKIPIEDAIQKAHGVTSAQFGQSVRDYFRVLAQAQQPTSKETKDKGSSAIAASPSIAVTGADEIGSSLQELPENEGQALVSEMSLRLPEHRDAAVTELESVTADPKRDNVIARRALAWDHLQKKDFDSAVEEFNKGAELNPRDPWLHYYLALLRKALAKAKVTELEGLRYMIQDLRLVLDWAPEFAAARAMLDMAQLEGGGTNAAMDSMRVAIRLSPRNQSYLLDMAQIYLAGKHWDAASALLERLKNSPDPQLAKSAREQLEGLPTLKKYGVMPQSASKAEAASAPPTAPAGSPAPSSSPTPNSPAPVKSDQASTVDDADQTPAPAQPDHRPIQHLKGKLVSVDCSNSPLAVVSIAAGNRSLKLRTENYQSLMIMGADQFSCGWINRPVAVNYRAGGKGDGDLSSLELQ
jgi:hypothetical protein